MQGRGDTSNNDTSLSMKDKYIKVRDIRKNKLTKLI